MTAPASPAKRSTTRERAHNSENFVPAYESMLFGQFADDNTPNSAVLYLALRHRVDNCGVADFIVDEDTVYYEKWMTEAEAEEALQLLVDKRYVIYDNRRAQVFIRTHVKFDRLIWKNSNSFKALVKNAKNIRSKVIREALGRELLKIEQRVTHPDSVGALADELIQELLGEQEAANARRSLTVASEAEWAEAGRG